MDHLFSQLASLIPFEFFGRAGGGGSGGGGGGGGSGDGEGGIEIALGYFPMHFVGALLAKMRKVNLGLSILAQILGWLVAIGYFVLLTSILRWYGGTIGAIGFVGMGAGLYGWFGKVKQSKFLKNKLKKAAVSDGVWDEASLSDYAQKTFMRYQSDWSNLNTDSMKVYMTPDYHYHASLLVYILQTMKRKNLMNNVVITSATIIDITDHEDNSQDTFTVGFTARANDQLVDAATNETIFTDNANFTEYWTFHRNGAKSWLLAGISQSTEDPYNRNAALAQFAASQGYRYSPDMGWLFIPRQGQLFGEAKFGTSDINNHVVGLYKGQMLVQIYTYNANPSGGSKNRVIAQVNVPRQYGNIIVRRKSRLNLFGIKNLQKIETEWTQFNDKYEVYASSYEGATSFELLNPTYMEQLEALGFTVTIEVVDNVIYLYTDERGSSVETYQTMLDLVNKAFNELRL